MNGGRVQKETTVSPINEKNVPLKIKNVKNVKKRDKNKKKRL